MKALLSVISAGNNTLQELWASVDRKWKII